MRHHNIERAKAEYDSAMDLYKQIKKVEEILLSILMVIRTSVIKGNLDRGFEYQDKAYKVFEKHFNQEVFRLAGLNPQAFSRFFQSVDYYSVEEYDEMLKDLPGYFDDAKLAQIQVVKEAKRKLDFQMS